LIEVAAARFGCRHVKFLLLRMDLSLSP
jgi:hypothetical protein